jgi:hypothetical protein
MSPAGEVLQIGRGPDQGTIDAALETLGYRRRVTDTASPNGPEDEQGNGHVKVGAKAAFALAGSVLLGIGTWAVADHVKFKDDAGGRLRVVESVQAQTVRTQQDHEQRIRAWEERDRKDAARDAILEEMRAMLKEQRARERKR